VTLLRLQTRAPWKSRLGTFGRPGDDYNVRVTLAIAWVFFALSAHAAEITPAMLEADSAMWPGEVTVSVAVRAPILLNGQKAGEINLPPGRTFPVKAVRPGMVTVEAAPGAVVNVSIADTDAIERATAAMDAKAAARAAATPVPTPPPRTPEATPTPPPAVSHAFAKRLTGDLVRLEKRDLVPVDPTELAGKKLIVLYHSKGRCGRCRHFTTDLVRFYRQKKSKHDKFDVLLVSNDHSAEEMLQYMIDDKMPWPAVAYDRLKDRHPVHDFPVKGIPCLIILDESGQPLPELQLGENYIGANAALEVLEKRLRSL
jgi:thioredoxin-related protein